MENNPCFNKENLITVDDAFEIMTQCILQAKKENYDSMYELANKVYEEYFPDKLSIENYCIFIAHHLANLQTLLNEKAKIAYLSTEPKDGQN
jgi:hypothetical protein